MGLFFGKKSKPVAEELTEDEALSVHWSELWPSLKHNRIMTLSSVLLEEPKSKESLTDEASVSMRGIFSSWKVGSQFSIEFVGDVGVRFHGLPRKYDHTGKPDLTNCVGLIALKNPKLRDYWVMLYNYQYGYTVYKGTPENLEGEPVVQRYQEKDRSFFLAKFQGSQETLYLDNFNWISPAKEHIQLDINISRKIEIEFENPFSERMKPPVDDVEIENYQRRLDALKSWQEVVFFGYEFDGEVRLFTDEELEKIALFNPVDEDELGSMGGHRIVDWEQIMRFRNFLIPILDSCRNRAEIRKGNYLNE